jgi:hypothetical protein
MSTQLVDIKIIDFTVPKMSTMIAISICLKACSFPLKSIDSEKNPTRCISLNPNNLISFPITTTVVSPIALPLNQIFLLLKRVIVPLNQKRLNRFFSHMPWNKVVYCNMVQDLDLDWAVDAGWPDQGLSWWGSP